MGLVLGLAQHQLDGTAQALSVLGDQQRPLSRGHPLGHATPEAERAVARQRVHEADRRAAQDAVDQHVDEPLEVRVFERVQASQGPGGGGHRRVSEAITTA